MKLTITLLFCFLIPYSRLEDIEWAGKWISAPRDLQRTALKNLSDIDSEIVKSHPGLKPVLFFRKPLYIDGAISYAILNCAAKGSFQA